jgi:hypothetical protein
MLKRRDALLTGLFGSGYLGLKALATGLPAWYLLDPRKANAQAMSCLLTNQANAQYLIVSTNFNGDPINCNCPGTYENAAAIHPQDPEMEKVTVTLGGKSYGAALPWADPSVANAAGTNTGQLKSATLARTAFFHYMTSSTVHGDQPKVMKLMGKTANNEMITSAYAKHLAPCFSTVQAEPIALGAGRNGSELLSFSGRSLPAVSPTQLKSLLGGGRSDVLIKLRTVRDTYVDKLNALAKTDGTGAQKAFLDAMALSQTQVRKLTDQLMTTLSAITADDAKGQGLAAAALFAANVTPVATIRLAFGGDNHSDQNLQAEADQHVTGIAGIQAVIDALGTVKDAAGNPLTDKVTFATMNVFGRNLNNIAKTESRSGRDHYGNHAVMVMIGKNVKAGVYGGIAGTSLKATAIDASTGASAPGASGANIIPESMTHVAAARTLGVALGIPESQMAGDFITSASTGLLVKPALSNV